MKFKLASNFQPSGDQPTAIKTLVNAVQTDEKDAILLGVTGSGKTFTMANVIAQTQKPTLIISHNKTLAAQLAGEFREFFPENAVEYFVSYYDYYQPEAYIARSDTYIEKETDINEEIDRLRHAAVQSILTRRDTIIVASVSCIYGLGSPESYKAGSKDVSIGSLNREQLLIALVDMQYSRNDIDFHRGSFRVRGDVVEVFQTSSEHRALRFDFFGNDLEAISEFDVLTGEVFGNFQTVTIFPATLYQAADEHFTKAVQNIRADMEREVAAFEKAGKLIEAQRLAQRTKFDLEMIENVGYVNGIENYSRYFDGREPGSPPFTLLDYFGNDYLLIIDESHQTIPQIGAMYGGDRSRKESLIDHGFRVSGAYDNRPLQFAEFEQRMPQTIYVSATPGKYEKAKTNIVAEQLIRPTGITEPKIIVKPVVTQVKDVLERVKERIDKGQRALITTLTKRMAEELMEYLNEQGIAVQYIHSDVDNMERLEILRDLRLGKYDVLIGINLLREGLDLPEVSLVAILDADKEGFLRSETALTQTMGRAARHLEGTAILYADVITGSMQRAMDEINRRRTLQEEYNREHNIVPAAIVKAIRDDRLSGMKKVEEVDDSLIAPEITDKLAEPEFVRVLDELRGRMHLAAENLEFEEAARLRDNLDELETVFRQRFGDLKKLAKQAKSGNRKKRG